MAKVNRNHLFQYSVFTPEVTIQKQHATALDRLAVEVKKLECIYRKKLDALDELKKSILKKAFTGQLTQGKAA